jgi:hypothetical protein
MANVRIYPGTPARVVIFNERMREEGESDQAFEARLTAHTEAADPTLVNGVTVDAATLPQDRNFRNAWRVNGQACAVDMPAAREIHRAKIRAARTPKLADLDTQWQRAQETTPPSQQTMAAIVQQKQALRDLPQNSAIDTAATPSALRALWPTALLGASPYSGH